MPAVSVIGPLDGTDETMSIVTILVGFTIGVTIALIWMVCGCVKSQGDDVKKDAAAANTKAESLGPTANTGLEPPPPLEAFKSKLIPSILKEPEPLANKTTCDLAPRPHYVEIGDTSQLKLGGDAPGPDRKPVLGAVPSREAAYRTLLMDSKFEATMAKKSGESSSSLLAKTAKPTQSQPATIPGAKKNPSMAPAAATAVLPIAEKKGTATLAVQEVPTPGAKGAATLAVKGVASVAVKGTATLAVKGVQTLAVNQPVTPAAKGAATLAMKGTATLAVKEVSAGKGAATLAVKATKGTQTLAVQGTSPVELKKGTASLAPK